VKRVLLPLGIIAGGFALAFILIATGPKLTPQSPTVMAPLVRVLAVTPESLQLSTSTHGTVEPRTESELVPEVSGRIIAMSPAMVSGGFFSEGEVLINIDPLDYEVALEQARAGLTRAESDLSNARKAHARQLDLARKQSTSASQRDDALNRLRIAEATYREAKAKLSKAERDVVRTRLVAPYDGRVRSERVDVGQFVNRGSSVAMLYATDFAEVKLPIHDEELAFLDLPLAASGIPWNAPIEVTRRARFAGQHHEWQGQVVRTEGELDPRTRMINVIARVPLPYAQDSERPPLSVGLFVEAEIHGSRVNDLVILPRSALRGKNRVFIVDQENRLRSRDVEVLRIVQDQVYVKEGLMLGDKVCISALESALDGMLVRPSESKTGSQVVRS
jgi:RND family efflux transporter MFP subunit